MYIRVAVLRIKPEERDIFRNSLQEEAQKVQVSAEQRFQFGAQSRLPKFRRSSTNTALPPAVTRRRKSLLRLFSRK